MKIFGLEIRRYKSKEEQLQYCRSVYYEHNRKTFYEWQKDYSYRYRGYVYHNIPWRIVGRSRRWLLIGSASTYAKGGIKKPNWDALDNVCNQQRFFCYRFIDPRHFLDDYHRYPHHL